MAEVSPVKKHVDYANSQVDEQAILDKFNAATTAQYNVQREQNRQAENQFYNQMYNTQQTAMDTIRKSNAAAVSTGASRGVQAANELSAILGLEQESVASATELANANRQTAQEETAAVLENVLKAYQQAIQEKQTMVQQGIEAESVVSTQQSAQATTDQTSRDALQSAAETGLDNYLSEVSAQGKNYTEYSTEGANSLNLALSTIQPADGAYFTEDDFITAFERGLGKESVQAQSKIANLNSDLSKIGTAYGIDLDSESYKSYRIALDALAGKRTVSDWASFANALVGLAGGGFVGSVLASLSKAPSKKELAQAAQRIYTAMQNQMRNDYAAKANITPTN